jgi:hypothetical protein
MAKTKTWTEKLNAPRQAKRVVLDKPFAGVPAGATLFVATPKLVDDWIRGVPRGETRTVDKLRRAFAAAHAADATCPASTAIFLRVVAEAACDAMANGARPAQVTPFWRVVDPDGTIAGKLSCGRDFIALQRAAER